MSKNLPNCLRKFAHIDLSDSVTQKSISKQIALYKTLCEVLQWLSWTGCNTGQVTSVFVLVKRQDHAHTVLEAVVSCESPNTGAKC